MLTLDTTQLHPSTLLCLEAIAFLGPRDFNNILDLGCGNGILSGVAAHSWPNSQIIAADISPNAVLDATRMVAGQNLSGRIQVIRSDGLSNPLILQQAPYDLMLCNLLAELLIENAITIQKNTTRNGIVVFSGLLEWKLAPVEAVYKNLNFCIEKKFHVSPWVCLALRNTIET